MLRLCLLQWIGFESSEVCLHLLMCAYKELVVFLMHLLITWQHENKGYKDET